MTENFIKDYISEDDLLIFEEKYNTELKNGRVSPETQFEYAWCLIRTQYKDDIQKGVLLLEGLCASNVDQRDYLFFISTGYYKLAEYSKALKYVKRLLIIEPSNHQAKDLENSIEKKMKSDGILGMAMVGGAALVAALVGAAFVKRGGS
ncbi:mitochondrial fission 1 protein-like isoform X2 [Hydractinia symbiolongicarpus]|uniref:mitochondrial fission 1 protein-like isoform X2 n=1 Tax=Hydractinia symbiolongicarpus TaxID=13093 RepID=UPI00254E58FB|nr:mitochondrial fission 1 protein-like isoform X2 [Hydractinia symbiolongicarpus]XP_057300940.1 mitochondrial fission 1 protein-like isoform X2 [Hydractinia symbiolongicarpus]